MKIFNMKTFYKKYVFKICTFYTYSLFLYKITYLNY